MRRSNQIKADLLAGGAAGERPLFLSSGSTMMNLACTGRPDACFRAGCYYHFVGDSDSGKTFLCLTCLAEACLNEDFSGHRIIYDAPERGALMNIRRFFGRGLEKRMEPPAREKNGSPHYSATVQEFYYHLDDALNTGPCIYVVDSQDSLSSDEEVAKFDERKTAFRKGKGTTGTYTDGKAKIHSSHLRKCMGPLASTGSILILINQTRDSFDLFERSTHGGGRALKFYCTLQLWSSQAGKIKRKVRGKDRELGTLCKVRVRRNRETGRDRTVTVPIYHSFGIDDVGSMASYLISENVWEKDGNVVRVQGIGPEFKMGQESLIQHVEENDLVEDVRALVVETWDEVERACQVKRKMRYE